MISHKLDVLLHHVGVHSRECSDGQRFFDMLHLNINSICNDVMNDNSAGTVDSGNYGSPVVGVRVSKRFQNPKSLICRASCHYCGTSSLPKQSIVL